METDTPHGLDALLPADMAERAETVGVAKAALPFFGCLVLCIVVITVFPDTVTWLPDLVMGKEK